MRPAPQDIRAFAALVEGRQVHYRRVGERGSPAFTDRGKEIDIYDSNRRASVLAALQLSAQKWGTFTTRGNDRFQRMCVELAVEHGFNIANPELQQTIAAGVCWGNIDTNQPGGAEYGSSACTGVVTGLQAAGKPCAIDLECVSGLTCVGWTGSTDGTCAMPGAAGQPCEQAADAGSALYIDYGFGSHPSCATGAYCVTPTCKAEGATGAACTEDQACMTGTTCLLGHCAAAGPSPEGGACDTKVDCVQGLYCALDDGGAVPGACTPREGQGGSCTTSGDQCKGLCVSPDGGVGGVCTALCGSG